MRAVEDGLGLGFVSARASAPAKARGQLNCVGLAGVNLSRHLYLAYAKNRSGDPLLARFLAFTSSYFGV